MAFHVRAAARRVEMNADEDRVVKAIGKGDAILERNGLGFPRVISTLNPGAEQLFGRGQESVGGEAAFAAQAGGDTNRLIGSGR